MKTQRKAKVKPAYKARAAKKVRSSVPKSNSKYPLAAYEHLHVGIVETSLTGKYIDANAEFCRVLGYSKKELLRLSIEDCTHDDDYGLDSKLHKQLVAGEISFYGLEKRFVQKEGGIVWVELTRSLIRDEEGKPVCAIGAVIDISDRKQVERSLRESAESLRLATEAARMFKWELDFQKQTYTFADNFVQVLGFSAGLLPQNSAEAVWRLSPAEDVQAISEAIAKAIENHSDLSSLQYRMIDPEDGQVVWLEANAKIVCDEAGNAQRMFGVAQNITEKKRVEEEIRIVSRMPDENPNPVVRLTPHGKILYTNQASAPLLAAWTQEAEPRIPDELQEAITDAFTSGVRTEVEIEHRGYFFSCTLAPIPEAGYVNLYGKDITKRKQAVEKLRESEERFRALVNQATAGIAQSDMDNRLIFVNPRFCEMLGYSESELIGRMIWELTYTDDLAENKRLFERMMTQGESYQFEKRFIRKDGSVLWTSVSVTTICDQAGKPTGGVGVVVDINERKQAEQALAEFARQQEALYHLSDQLHHTKSLEDVYNAALDAILSALQCDRASILLFDDTGVMRFVAWRGLSDRYRKATEGHSPWSADEKNPYPICVGDIRTADLSDSLKATVQEEGIGSLAFIPLLLNRKLIGRFMVYFNTPHNCTDVEIELGLMIARQLASGIDRKRAEVELRESEERYRSIVDTANEGIWYIDMHAETVYLNEPLADILGYSISEVVGRKLPEFCFDEDLPLVQERVASNHRGNYEHFDFRFRRKDGSEVLVLASTSPVRDAAGKIIGALGMFVDVTERKRAEERLRASEERLRVTFDTAVVGFATLTPSTRFVEVNDAFCQIVGYTADELLQMDCAALMHPFYIETTYDHVTQLIEGKIPSFVLEKLYIRKDGRQIWVQDSVSLVRNADGTPLHLIAICQDVTERKQAEDALRQSEERFVRFMQHLPGLAWIKDVQGRYVYANAAVEKAFNTPREQLYGKTDLEVFPPALATQFIKNDEQALADEKGVQTVETLPQEDDVLRYSLVSKFPIPGPDGRPALIGGTAFDITERLKAEEALRVSEERLRAILSQATAGIVRKDAEGRLIFVNQAFCNMLGYTESELFGKTIWEVTHQEDIEGNRRLFKHLMTKAVPFKLEKRLIRQDGSTIWVDVSVSPIMDIEGRPESAVAVEVDVTRRKEAEEALHQLNLQLESRVQKRTATIQAMNQSLRDEIAERKRIEEALRQSEATARASEEKLRTLFDLLPVGITFLDPKGKILQLNSAVTNIVRLSKEQLFNEEHRSRKYIRADGSPMPLSEFASARALRENRTIYNVETGIVLENGEVIWMSISAAPVDVAGVGVVVVTVDITDTKHAERALKESHRRLRILSQRLVEVQEEERRALARELHDRVGQSLAALNINLIIIDSQLSPEVARQIGVRLNDSMKLVAETIALVRDVMTDLRPAVLDDYGLEAALESQLSKFTSRYNIRTVFEKPDRPIPRLGSSVEMTFLRIAQEALMNIARHAQAKLVTLSLRQEEDAICMSIQDNGIGIESWQDANRPGSHGLTIMRERADAFGGKLKVTSVPGQGTTVEVTIPFKNDGQEKVEEQHL